MRVTFFGTVAIAVFFGGLYFARQAQLQSDTVSLAIVVAISFLLIIICLTAAR